jgi:hypothetical protein
MNGFCRRDERLDAAGRTPHSPRFAPHRRYEAGALSPIESLSPAWDATLRLLFRPFNRRRWISLSIVCLFLGGGTSTAAFQWGFGTLPIDIHASEFLARARLVMAEHASLIVLAVLFSVALVLSIVYIRCVFRFILVDAVIKQDVSVREAWKRMEPAGRTYFLWLLAVVGAMLVFVCAAAIGSFRYLNFIREAGDPEWFFSVVLVMELVAVVGVGVLVAIAITVTDDLVAPLMYAEHISLPAAWKMVWKMSRRDSATFFFYVVLRFAVGMGISIAVLFVLFPVLMGLSSGALVTAALGIFALRAVGLAWAWNPVTFVLGALALGIFSSLLFALLSIIGMPGQVYLQNYGVRFIASRVPSLATLCRAAAAQGRTR